MGKKIISFQYFIDMYMYKRWMGNKKGLIWYRTQEK